MKNSLEQIKWELRYTNKPCERCKRMGKETRARRYRKLSFGRYELLCDDCFINAIGNGKTETIEYR